MSDIDTASQDAVSAQLRNDAGVISAFGANDLKLYDLVAPNGAAFPYMIADYQIVGDDTECAEGSEVVVDVHIYARLETHAESVAAAKAIAGAVRRALTRKLIFAGHSTDDWTYEGTRHLRDPDSLTAHAIVTVTYLTTADA